MTLSQIDELNTTLSTIVLSSHHWRQLVPQIYKKEKILVPVSLSSDCDHQAVHPIFVQLRFEMCGIFVCMACMYIILYNTFAHIVPASAHFIPTLMLDVICWSTLE